MKKDSAAVLAKKRSMVAARVDGLASANSSDLSRSFGLPAEEVKRILRNKGVNDDG